MSDIKKMPSLLDRLDNLLDGMKSQYNGEYDDRFKRPELVPYEEVGEFSLESTYLRATDPCYERGSGGLIANALPGKWKAAVERVSTGMWGHRISQLLVWESTVGSSELAKKADEDSTFEVSVDSGQAGFFDDSKYDGRDGDAVLQAACDSALGSPFKRNNGTGQLPYGVLCMSGFGDGGYKCFLACTGNGAVVAARIEFITAEDLKEEEVETPPAE